MFHTFKCTQRFNTQCQGHECDFPLKSDYHGNWTQNSQKIHNIFIGRFYV